MGRRKTEWKNPGLKIGISSVGWKNPGASLLSGKQLKSFTPMFLFTQRCWRFWGPTLEWSRVTQKSLEKPEKVAKPSANHVSKRPYQKPSSGRPSKPALMALSEAFRRILHNHAEEFGRQIHSLYMDDSWFCNRASTCVSAKSWGQETASNRGKSLVSDELQPGLGPLLSSHVQQCSNGPDRRLHDACVFFDWVTSRSWWCFAAIRALQHEIWHQVNMLSKQVKELRRAVAELKSTKQKQAASSKIAAKKPRKTSSKDVGKPRHSTERQRQSQERLELMRLADRP